MEAKVGGDAGRFGEAHLQVALYMPVGHHDVHGHEGRDPGGAPDGHPLRERRRERFGSVGVVETEHRRREPDTRG